ncbi:MAG: hypothetical protein ABG776_05580 [Cyanobacteria bacterium J06555_13]
MKLSPDDFQALELARYETNLRSPRKYNIAVSDYDTLVGSTEEELLKPGVLGVFLARKGSEASSYLEKLKAGEEGVTGSLAALIHNETKDRHRMPLSEAVGQMLSEDSFCEIRHADKTLAGNVYIPEGVSCVPFAFPFTGGKLREDSVEILDFAKLGRSSEFEIFAFSRKPDDLTDVEIEALDMLGENDLALNTGNALCWAVTAVAFASAVCATTGICCPHANSLDDFDDGVTDPPPPWVESGLMGMATTATVANLLHRRTLALRHT